MSNMPLRRVEKVDSPEGLGERATDMWMQGVDRKSVHFQVLQKGDDGRSRKNEHPNPSRAALLKRLSQPVDNGGAAASSPSNKQGKRRAFPPDVPMIRQQISKTVVPERRTSYMSRVMSSDDIKSSGGAST